MRAFKSMYTVKNRQLIIDLPDEFTDSEVEVIVLQAGSDPTKETMDLSALKGSINTGLTVEEVDAQLQKIRSEWERDIC